MELFKKIAGNIVAKIAIKAQSIPLSEVESLWEIFYQKNKINLENNRDALHIKRELRLTPAGAILDTIELVSLEHVHAQEYIIYGWGRSCCYEFHLARLASDALNLNKKIVSFNYRNIGRSKGSLFCEKDLVNDYLFQIKYLLAQGVEAEKIICYGHSLGGAVAALAVQECHQEGYGVKLYNDRSFGNLVDTSVSVFLHKPPVRKKIITLISMALLTMLTMFSIIFLPLWLCMVILASGFFFLKWQKTYSVIDKEIGNLLEKGMRALMHYSGWEMNAAHSFEAIPQALKHHTVILPTVIEDGVIPYEHSLYRHLISSHQLEENLKAQLIEARKTQQKQKAKVIIRQLIALNHCKMIGGDHMADPKMLFTRYKSAASGRRLNGQEHFYAFAEPKGQHECKQPLIYKNFQC